LHTAFRRCIQLVTTGIQSSPDRALDALERTFDALQDLQVIGPVGELIERGPFAAARSTGLDRVLLTSVEDGCLHAEALHVEGEDTGALLERVRDAPARIEYPLIEAEIMRRRRPVLATGATSRSATGPLMGWSDHVVAPVLVEGRVVGFFHADRGETGPAVDDADRDALWRFALLYAAVFECAVLRGRLRAQRRELHRIASWADARTSELDDQPIGLRSDRTTDDVPAPAVPAANAAALRDLMTRREIEVLELMVRGETNGAIARALVVTEGTIKFHVKNILRKLHAANRAEAASRYLRLTMPRRDGPERSR
jgi:LuxR family transcriptional regulator, regulator of acetate metabolism